MSSPSSGQSKDPRTPVPGEPSELVGRLETLDKCRWFLVALLPVVSSTLFVLVVVALSLVRYDPVYFSSDYTERYGTPASVAHALERALQTDDQVLLAELQGLRRPTPFKTDPNIVLIMLLDRDAVYYDYLYSDERTYARYVYHVQKVRGRWVVAPSDPHYYLCSGRWLATFGPLVLLWWMLEAVVILAVWGFRAAARFRARMYGVR